MADPVTIPVQSAQADPATAPPKRWRNLWRVEEGFECADSGEDFEPGDLIISERLYPSEDVARTSAQRHLERMVRGGDWALCAYIGPVVVEE